MDNKNVINKIKKLMAIANDPSASDQEIQLSTYKANKLMIENKINEIEQYGEGKDHDVLRMDLDTKGIGYIIWSLNVLGHHFRCKVAYVGKINSHCKFILYGLRSDLEMCKPVAEALIYYLHNNIKDLKASYIGFEDFRIFKRDYLRGFSNGLSIALERAFIEMNVGEKYELLVIGVPEVVEETFKKKVNIRKRNNFYTVSQDGYELGRKQGSHYSVEEKNLLGG